MAPIFVKKTLKAVQRDFKNYYCYFHSYHCRLGVATFTAISVPFAAIFVSATLEAVNVNFKAIPATLTAITVTLTPINVTLTAISKMNDCHSYALKAVNANLKATLTATTVTTYFGSYHSHYSLWQLSQSLLYPDCHFESY